MQNFNPQQIAGNGYIVIPKLMFAKYMSSCDNHEGDIEAFLKLLMKVNYSETEYTDYWCKKNLCKRGESLRSYRSWGDVFHWSTGRTYRFLQGLKSKGLIEIIPHDDTAALHIRVVDYERWVTIPKADPESVKRQKKEAQEKFRLFWDGYHSVTQLQNRRWPSNASRSIIFIRRTPIISCTPLPTWQTRLFLTNIDDENGY